MAPAGKWRQAQGKLNVHAAARRVPAVARGRTGDRVDRNDLGLLDGDKLRPRTPANTTHSAVTPELGRCEGTAVCATPTASHCAAATCPPPNHTAPRTLVRARTLVRRGGHQHGTTANAHTTSHASGRRAKACSTCKPCLVYVRRVTPPTPKANPATGGTPHEKSFIFTPPPL